MDGSPWPRITIVTPSFQQARFLEESIRSVLLQGYPALEYLVLDGGSSDESPHVIRRYSRWLSHWRSSPDAGQAAAVQEGWERGSGDIVAFLNADDLYLPGALATVARRFAADPNAAAWSGQELGISADGMILGIQPAHSAQLHELLRVKSLPQPAVFLRRSVLEAVGGIQMTYPLIFDFDLWVRVASQGLITVIPQVLAATREHEDRISTRSRKSIAEELERYARAAATDASLPIDERQRARFRARLNYVIASIYADAPLRQLSPLIAATVRAIVADPLIIGDLASGVVSRLKRDRPQGHTQAHAMPLHRWAMNLDFGVQTCPRS